MDSQQLQTPVDLSILDEHYCLTDDDINQGLQLISAQWPDVKTQNCLLIQRPQCFEPAVRSNFGDYCQILHDASRSHWIAVTNIRGNGKVRVFDSLSFNYSFKLLQAIASKQLLQYLLQYKPTVFIPGSSSLLLSHLWN